MSKISGAEIVCKALINEGVTHIFGLPGGVTIPLYDAFVDFPQLQHVLVRHEQGAMHMADGYARVSGRVGVVCVTSGPGATNCITGILNAYMDSVPLVVLTGQVASHKIGQDSFQEADTVGITRPITKYNYLVTEVDKLAYTIHEAFYIARTGKPGPVLVDLPVDILRSKAEYVKPEQIRIRGYNPVTEGHPRQIQRAAEAIARAKRPVIYAGHGVVISDAAPELFEFATKANIPVTTTILGLGAFPENHPLSMGMLGMHGTWYANTATHEADLLIAIGARFDDRITGDPKKFAPRSEKVHIDVDPTSIGKVIETHYPIVGDVKNVLQALIPLVPQGENTEWLKQIEIWKKDHPMWYSADSELVKPHYVIEKLAEITKSEAIICTDVGQHQMWAAQYCKVIKPRSFVSSGGLGTMGFGFPAAIGAALARPGEQVVCISGDGSFQMNMQELATAVRLKLAIKVVILNNAHLGMVRQWQDLFWEKRFSQVDLSGNPDFVLLAESFGAVGLRATKASEVEPILRKAWEINDRPVVIDFIIPKDEKVFPMIPSGASVAEMMDIR